MLKEHVPDSARKLKPIGRVPGPKRLNLIIGLPLRNQDRLTNLLEQIYDPTHTNYHRYLTSEQFAERFGGSEKDYQGVLAFATSHGLTVTGLHSNRTLIDVSGPVSAIERTFHLNLRLYQHPREPRTFHAPDMDPSLDLPVPILAISGLDDYVIPRPLGIRPRTLKQLSGGIPYATGSGPLASFMGGDFRAAYAPGVLQDGRGQAIGLFQLDGYHESDIAAYKAIAGLPNIPVRNVLVNGASGIPGQNNSEVALDIDMAMSMAPGLAEVIVYEGLTPNDVLNRMATDNQARQLSSSWGFGPQVDPIRQQIFQQFAAQGQSMFQASGDLGAWTGDIFPPSDDPWVTVVGGTSLTTSVAGGGWSSETTWPGSGGGISTTYSIPSWQQGIDMSSNQGSLSMRNIPDVACMADSEIWVVANNGEFLISGGTSAAAPLWAGFAALVNEEAAARGMPSVGFLNPAIYSIGKELSYQSNFHDITTGNNINNPFSKFSAVPGYDLCTGWGTPSGSNLIAALLSPPNALRITPATSVLFTGPVGGPFNPNASVYTLTNAGTVPMSWSFVNPASWLNPSSGSGTLSPGGPSYSLTFHPNSVASNLPAGSYSTTVWFTNLNDQYFQSRSLTLAVVTPPVITLQPSDQGVMEGATVIFSVRTATNSLLRYQWRKDNGAYLTNLVDGTNLFGATTSSLIITNAISDDVGAYSVVVSNAAGTIISSNAFLTILPWHPTITAQPQSQTLLQSETLNLDVTAIGSAPLEYRWRKNGTNLINHGQIVGADSSHLSMANMSPTDTGDYSVVVTNALGAVTSAVAVVEIQSLLAPGTTFERLYSFKGGMDGSRPNGLTRITNGMLYGTAADGGAHSLGTIFRISDVGALTPLYSFSGDADGATPFAPLMQAADGNLYGTTFQAGRYDFGTVFKVTPEGMLTPLVSLNVTNGDLPYAGLTAGADGNAYGTTYKGGATFGTIFKLSTNGTLTTLYSFSGGTDGGLVYAGLVQGADNFLNGTTYKGGQYGYGTVFRSSTNGFVSSLLSFNGTNGSFPLAGLVQDNRFNFYGATSSGGAYTNGTLFKMDPTGVLTSLYSFTGGQDGGNPAATLLTSNDGNFYGTTENGGAYGKGTVFRIAPNGTFVTLVQFDGFDGANPAAALVEGANGTLYGTTPYGGVNDRGTVYRLSFYGPAYITSQPDSQSVFAGANVLLTVSTSGGLPLSYQWRLHGTNINDGGNVFGSSSRILRIANVQPINAGFYSVVVSNSLANVQSEEAALSVTVSPPLLSMQPTNLTLAPGENAVFTVDATGNLPLVYQWQTNGVDINDGRNISGARSSALVITKVTEANNGAYSVKVSNGLGETRSREAVLTVVPTSLAGTRLKTLDWFSGGTGGRVPNGLMRASNGILYGTTQFGGSRLVGTAFSISANGLLTILASFDGTNGSWPISPLVQTENGKFYGTSKFGGAVGYGTVFEMTGSLSSLYSFTGESDGGNPVIGLVQASDGNLYGSSTGVSDSFGKLFKLSPSGSFTVVHSFTGGLDGDRSAGELVQARNGKLYGMSVGGGAHGRGNVFELGPDGTVATLYSFSGGFDGYAPAGALVEGTDGNLYGVTAHNRIGNFEFYGTMFKITTTGLLTTLYPLNYTDGSYPAAGLIQSSDGNFYGVTEFGGVSGNGTLFRLSPRGTFTKLADLDGTDTGAHPRSALVEGVDGSFYGSTSSGGPGGGGTVFKLSITSPLQITSQPSSQSVLIGGKSSFEVAVFGASPIYYQWTKNGTNLFDDTTFSGATNRILVLNNARATDAGTYSVMVSNALGSVTSVGAVLMVLPAPIVQTISRADGTVYLAWAAEEQKRYQLQYRANLITGGWSNLGGVITALGSSARASDLIGSNAQRFYRVLLLP